MVKFSEESCSEYTYIEKKRRTSNSSHEKLFHKWTKQENLEYAHFLSANREILRTKKDRQLFACYKIMAEGLSNNRTATQCRTHH